MVDQLHGFLVKLMDKTKWDGPELRITGNSLGTQVALGISAKFRTDDEHTAYGAKLQRIALFDHYMSGNNLHGKLWWNAAWTLGKSPCRYINEEVLPKIRSGLSKTLSVI